MAHAFDFDGLEASERARSQEDAVPREILAALQVLLQSRDQVLQDALSGVSVRDQARLRFLLGRLQLRRDVQELDYVPQLAPLSSQSGSRVSRAVDAFVQVEQATATVSELGVQSEAPSFSSQETQTSNQGLYAQVMEHLVSLAPPGQPKMTFAAVVQKAPPQPRTAAGQGNFHGQLGPLSKSATGKGGASRTSSTTQEPRQNVFQDTAPVAKAATFQTSSVPQESAQDSAQDTPPVVQDPPLAGVALTQETAAVQDVLQSDAATGFPTAAAVGTQERRDSRGPGRRERQPRTVVRLPLHFKGKGKGSSFDRFGYRPALDNLGEQAPLSGMAGFLALARQENLPPPGAPTSLIAQYKGFLFAPLSVVGFDGQLPVGSPESRVLLPLRGRRHRQLPPKLRRPGWSITGYCLEPCTFHHICGHACSRPVCVRCEASHTGHTCSVCEEEGVHPPSVVAP